MAVPARIVNIGNSKGIRIPKSLLAQSGLSGEVQLEVREEGIVIMPVRRARQGWDEAFRAMAKNGDDALLDADAAASQWDETAWQWE